MTGREEEVGTRGRKLEVWSEKKKKNKTADLASFACFCFFFCFLFCLFVSPFGSQLTTGMAKVTTSGFNEQGEAKTTERGKRLDKQREEKSMSGFKIRHHNTNISAIELPEQFMQQQQPVS